MVPTPTPPSRPLLTPPNTCLARTLDSIQPLRRQHWALWVLPHPRAQPSAWSYPRAPASSQGWLGIQASAETLPYQNSKPRGSTWSWSFHSLLSAKGI